MSATASSETGFREAFLSQWTRKTFFRFAGSRPEDAPAVAGLQPLGSLIAAYPHGNQSISAGKETE
ncbi:hypothetical protein FP026_26040 [Rhizobium tropici]|uniref:Uncharacterized protein n=1 Tax=Rhizobium tropici TaxID=398 RepID=A0A5B0VR60_RHITR|nr:hypothetical protein FP026_26040 [Rhizobium tropici]